MLRTAKHVKIEVARYRDTASTGSTPKPGEYIRGCLIPEGVYAITTTTIRVLWATGPGQASQ